MAGGGWACLRTMTDAMAKGQARRRRHCARCACHFSSAQRENADLQPKEGAHVGRGGESGCSAEPHLNAEALPRSKERAARPRTDQTSLGAWPPHRGRKNAESATSVRGRKRDLGHGLVACLGQHARPVHPAHKQRRGTEQFPTRDDRIARTWRTRPCMGRKGAGMRRRGRCGVLKLRAWRGGGDLPSLNAGSPR